MLSLGSLVSMHYGDCSFLIVLTVFIGLICGAAGFIFAMIFALQIMREIPEEYFNNPFSNTANLAKIRDEIIEYKRLEIEKVIRQEKENIEKKLEKNLKKLKKSGERQGARIKNERQEGDSL
jgi:hypothetical protein